jgi:glycosyltransferase involved in cell wall biosynthesis
LNILHLSSEKTWRGGEQQIAYLIAAHKKLGVNSFIASKKQSEFSKYCVSQGWKYIQLPFSNSIDLVSAFQLKRYCNQKKIDIVHMHSSGSHGVGVLSAALGNKSKFVLSRRVDFELKNNYLSRWKYNHPSIKKILCVSNKIKEIVQKSISNPSICETIYSGIDLSKFDTSNRKNDFKSKYNIAEKNFIIGNTSALADHKDYFTFVNTAKEVVLKHPYSSFIIFGKGPLEKEIKEYVSKLGLDAHFIFTGFVDNIPELLPQLDLFLMTSKTEGLGTSLLDAMACKIPIVATEAGGIPEIVINEKTGLTADIGDHQQLSKLVLKIIKTPSIGKSLSDNAFSFVKKFDRKVTAEQTLEVYTNLIARNA